MPDNEINIITKANETNLSNILSDAFTATLEAEMQGQKQYLNILTMLKDMPPFSFSFVDENGNKTVLQVPVITLVPLSMLHIEEAEFNYTLAISYSGHSEGYRREYEINPDKKYGINFNGAFIYDDSVIGAPKKGKHDKGKMETLKAIEIFTRIEGDQLPIFRITTKDGSSQKYYQSRISPYYYAKAKNKEEKRKQRQKHKQQIKLLSFGRPHIALWEMKSSISETELRPMISFYDSGLVIFENKEYRHDVNGKKTINIRKPLFNNRAGRNFALKTHIAKELYINSTFTQIEKESNFNVSFNENEELKTNLTVKVKMSQSSIPTGMYEILQRAGNNVKLIQGS